MQGANDNRPLPPPFEPRGMWIDGIGYVTEPPEWTRPRVELSAKADGDKLKK